MSTSNGMLPLTSQTDEAEDDGCYMAHFKNLIEPERQPCMTKQYRPLIPYKMPKYLTPNDLKRNVLTSARVRDIIDKMSNGKHAERKKTMATVKKMLDEIGLERSLPVIRWLGMCITAILKRICTAVYVNETNLNKVKAAIGKNPVLYLPSHRSYADFVLMSYICFAYNIEIPGIAAGMDFHSMAGMGNLLRKTGAFFMRRTFASDKLYWYVFKEYMNSLMTVYHTGVEFFIEGTRSRSLKALAPKIGLLSMALEPFFMGEVSDVTIVPVSVSYEKPLEESLFVYELLGVPKPKETTMGLLKALKILDERYGRIHFDFGEPILASEYFKGKINRALHANAPAHVQVLGRNELQRVNELAYDVVRVQQNNIVLNAFNLMTVIYSYRMYVGKTTSLKDMSDGVSQLSICLKHLGAHLTIFESLAESELLDMIDMHSNVFTISQDLQSIELTKSLVDFGSIDPARMKGHRLSVQAMSYSIPIFALQLYSNPCMHWLAQASFIVLSIKRLSGNNEVSINDLYAAVKELRIMFGIEFVLHHIWEEEDFKLTIKFLVNANIVQICHNNNQIKLNCSNAEMAEIILSTLAPFLCCYLQTATTIMDQFCNTPFTEKELFEKVQEATDIGLAERCKFIHPYCLSLDSIGIALQSFTSNDFVERSRRANLTVYEVNLTKLACGQKMLLDYCQLLPFEYSTQCISVSKL